MSDFDLNKKSLFAPLGEEMWLYYEWFISNPPPAVPREIIYQGAGTEAQMPFMHLATCAPAYVVAGRYIRELGKHLGRPPRVLEVGCGTGIGVYYLKTQATPRADISGIDFSGKAIAYAQEHYRKSGVEYIAAKAQKLPFEDEQFDIVFSVQVLEHIPKEDAAQFVEEVGKVLKKEGLALISTPNRELCQDLYYDNPNDDYDRRLIPSHEHEYYRDELKALFEGTRQNRERLFREVQVNSQINLLNRKLWTSGVSRLAFEESIFGNLKRRFSNFSRRRVPLNVQNWIGRKSWEVATRMMDISYKDIALGSKYHQEVEDVKADSFLVVVKK